MSHSILAVMPGVAAAGMAGLALFASRRRAPAAGPFALCTVAVGVWCGAYAAELVAASLSGKLLAAVVAYVGITAVPPTLLAVSLHAARRGSWLRRSRVIALCVVPVVTVALAATNGEHGLLWSSVSIDGGGPLAVLAVGHGPWFWIHTAYGYLLLLSATAILLHARLHRTPDGVAMLLGMGAPWAANAAYVLGSSPVPGLDLTPFAFAFTAAAFAWGLRRGLLSLVPIARDALLESMTDGMIVLDPQRRIVDLNPAGASLLGSDRCDALGLRLVDAFGESLPVVEGLLGGRIVGGDATVLVDRGDRNLEVHALRLGEPGARPRGALLVVRDVTERVRADDALRRAMAAAESGARAKSRFLATMSHEIRTPMNGIVGTAELLLRSDLTGAQRALVHTIDDSAEALLVVINDILDFSRIEVGRLEIVPAPFDLDLVIRQIAALMQARATAKGLELVVEAPDDAPCWFLGDVGRIRQVLLNLAGNAVKFTEHGRITIAVEAGEEIDPDTRQCPVVLTVRDTGIGIPRGLQGRIFEEFTQVDPSSTRRHEGTGLGLAIVRQLVELMGGAVRVKSEPGRGSEFRVDLLLPRTDPVDDAGGAPEPSAGPRGAPGTSAPGPHPAPVVPGRPALPLVAPPDPAPSGRPLRILLAEDNEVNRRVAGLMLESLGAMVDFVGDGKEAVELRFRNRYDVILMDVQMPRMDGLEAARMIRSCEAAGDRVPIIALTANALPADRQLCLDAGMDHHLRKPIRRGDLEGALRRVAAPAPHA